MSEEKLSTEIVQETLSAVAQSSGSIITAILQALAGTKLDGLRGLIKDYTGKNLFLAESFKTGDVEGVPGHIENTLTSDYNVIIDGMKTGIGLGVGGMFSSLYDSLTGTSRLLSSYNGLIQRVSIDPYIQRWLMRSYSPTVPRASIAFRLLKLGVLDQRTYDLYFSYEGYPTSLKTALETSWTKQPNPDKLIEMNRRNIIDDDELKKRLKWTEFDDVAQNALLVLKNEIPDANSLISFRLKDLINDEYYKGNMKSHGFEPAFSDLFRQNAFRYPDAGTSLDLYRKGKINILQFQIALKRSGLPNEYITAIEATKTITPGVGDLLKFGHKRAYGGHVETEQYSKFLELANRHGIDSETASWYWYGDYSRIPIGFALDNVYRGLWNTSKFLDILDLSDIHPDDRKDILNVIYKAPSLRELGYGFDSGYFTFDDLLRAKKWSGLSPDDASKAANSLVEYRTNSVRNGVRTALLNLFAHGKITEDQFKTDLRGVRTNETAIALWVQRGKLQAQSLTQGQIEAEGKIVSSSEAIKAFKNALITEADLRSRLTALEWAADRIDLAVREAKYEMAPTGEIEKPKEFKTLSESTIKTAREIGLLSDSQALERVTALGYDSKDASLMVDVQRFEILRGEVDKLLAEADTDYFNGWINEDTLRADYGATPYGSDVVDLLVERARERRDRNMKEDLKTALLDRYKKGDLSDSEISQELSRLGLVQEWISSEVARAQATKLTKVKNEPTSTLKTLSEEKYSRAFKYGLIDESAYRSKLELFKYGDDDIELLVSLNQPEKPPEPTLPDLSLGELKSAYRSQILTEQLFRAELTKRGYDDEDARVIVATEKVKLEAAIAKAIKAPDKIPVEKIPTLTLGELKSSFKAQIISSADLRTELGIRKYAPELTDIIVFTELSGQKEDLLRTAYRHDIITRQELAFELTRREYGNTDIKNILTDEDSKRLMLTRGP
jgi:hypothetical protein